MAEAKAIADPDARTKALLSAFRFCVQEACAAEAESRDIETYNVGVRQLGMISDALRDTPPNRFNELAQFLDDPDIEVRGFAAVWLRDVMPERILPILKEIDKTEGFGTPVGTQVSIAIRELEQAQERKGESESDPDTKP